MDIIEIIILVAIAISGTVFGSFFTLAVHRIPRKEDITHERSYCPNCNHKLQFLDLIPVFSYIFLGGKCRYCKNKIRPRYLILEICSGLVFLFMALSYGINITTTIPEFISFAILVLFLCCVFIVAGIDKEKYIIPNGLLIYGTIIAAGKLIFESVVLKNDVYINLVGAIAIPIIFLLINAICKKGLKMQEEPFGAGDIKYLSVLGLFCGFGLQVMIVELSLLFILIHKLVGILTRKEKFKIAWGFYLSISCALLLIILPNITGLVEAFNYMIMF